MDWLFELPSMLRTAIIIAVDVGIVTLVLFVLPKIGVKVIGGLSIAAWFQGLKNFFFTFLVIGAFAGSIAIIPIFGFEQSIKNGFEISFAIIWIVLCVWFIFAWYSRGQRAGSMLLDIIPLPNRWLFLIMGALAIILGFLGSLDYIWVDTEYSRLISIVVGLSAGIVFVIVSFSRIQVHENGILAYVDLIKWSKIESFEWVYDNQKLYTLKLRYKGKLPAVLRGGAIPVPVEKKEKLESLFAQRLPEIVQTQNRS